MPWVVSLYNIWENLNGKIYIYEPNKPLLCTFGARVNVGGLCLKSRRRGMEFLQKMSVVLPES